MGNRTNLALLAACLALAGCSTGGTEMTYSPSDPLRKIEGFYTDGVGGRDLKLVVYGNPFKVPDADFARAVEADLHDGTVVKREPTHPTLNPGPSAKPLYRLVYVFNPAGDLNGQQICYRRKEPQTVGEKTDMVQALAAFCVGGQAVTYISGQTGAAGPGDARFYRLTRDMMAAVFRPDVRWEASPPPVRTP